MGGGKAETLLESQKLTFMRDDKLRRIKHSQQFKRRMSNAADKFPATEEDYKATSAMKMRARKIERLSE